MKEGRGERVDENNLKGGGGGQGKEWKKRDKERGSGEEGGRHSLALPLP